MHPTGFIITLAMFSFQQHFGFWNIISNYQSCTKVGLKTNLTDLA